MKYLADHNLTALSNFIQDALSENTSEPFGFNLVVFQRDGSQIMWKSYGFGDPKDAALISHKSVDLLIAKAEIDEIIQAVMEEED